MSDGGVTCGTDCGHGYSKGFTVSVWLGLVATTITASRSPDGKTRILYIEGIFGMEALTTVRK